MSSRIWTTSLIVALVRGGLHEKSLLGSHLVSSSDNSIPNIEELNTIIANHFPFYKSSCVGDALKDFLPRCLKYGVEAVEPKVRVESAIKLSFCEFEESGLGHVPSSCEELTSDGTKRCIDEMRSTPQWWTTYSGNYQRLPTLCYENSLPFEKEQYLELFLNITRMYSTFSEILDTKLQEKFSVLEEATEQNLNNLKEAFEKHFKHVNESFSSQAESFSYSFDEVQGNALVGFTNNVLTVQKQVIDFEEDLWGELRGLKSYLEELNSELATRDHIKQLKDLKEESLGSMIDVRDRTLEVNKETAIQLDLASKHFQAFDSKAVAHFSQIDEDISNSYLEMISTFRDFRSLVQNSIIPIIGDEMTPQLEEFSRKFKMRLQDATSLLENKTEYWSDNFDDTFKKVHTNLNLSAESVRSLSTDLQSFKSDFKQFFTVLEFLKGSISGIVGTFLTSFKSLSTTKRSVVLLMLFKSCPAIFNFIKTAALGNTLLLGRSFFIFCALTSGSLIGFNLL